MQEITEEGEFRRRRQPIVYELAGLLPESGLRIGIDESAGDNHRAWGEMAEELLVHAAAAQFGRGRRIEIAVQQRRGGRPERRERGKAVDDRHVHENAAHVIPTALAMALIELARQPLRIGARASGSDEAPLGFGGRAGDRLRIQCVATEEIDLLQLREQSGTGLAAGRALHFGDRKRFTHGQPVGVELGPAVEMAGDDQQIAANALPASRSEPIPATALHQLDKLVLVFRQSLAKNFPFVGRIDGDGANGALACVRRHAAGCAQQEDHEQNPGGHDQGAQDVGLIVQGAKSLPQLVRPMSDARN
ncbi:MAG: hypothetical protein ABWZ29_00595 [Casimicrobiaceae bacterium]